MTPKEKAEELVDKFIGFGKRLAKQCALIAVDEIMKALDGMFGTVNDNFFWIEVKQEIEKI